MMFSWADCAAPFGCLNLAAYDGDEPIIAQSGGLYPVVASSQGGADAPITSEALLESAETGDLDTVLRILAAGTVDVDAVDEVDSYSALMMASEAGHLQIVKALSRAGADVESRDSYGRTPLYAAAVAGHLDVVEFLVRDARADVNATDCERRSVLWACCAVRRVDVAAVLLEASSAAGNGDSSGNVASLDAPAGSGETAIDFAVKHGHAEVAEFLRLRGAVDSTRGRLTVVQ